MPLQIGRFISGCVYEGELKSSASHPLAETPGMTYHFVNVGGKQISVGTSWKVSSFQSVFTGTHSHPSES